MMDMDEHLWGDQKYRFSGQSKNRRGSPNRSWAGGAVNCEMKN
jgi:hypothetical protein